MPASGWQEDVAIEAMETTLQQHLDAEVMRRGSPSAVLESLEPQSWRICCSTWMLATAAHVLQASVPASRIVVFGDPLLDEERDALIDRCSAPRMARSLTVGHRAIGGQEVNDDRTSNGMFFTRGESEVIARIEAHRAARELAIPSRTAKASRCCSTGPAPKVQAALRLLRAGWFGTPSVARRRLRHAGDVPERAGQGRGHRPSPDTAMEVAPKRQRRLLQLRTSAPVHPSLHGGARSSRARSTATQAAARTRIS